MSTSTTYSNIGRLVIGAACVIATSACGSDMLRTGRSPAYLVITSMQGESGGPASQTSAFLQSDVQVLVDQTVNGVTRKVATIFNDNATAAIRAELKNPTVGATAINSITITRYHVSFRRADGRNTPGVDVPYAFDGAVSAGVSSGSTTNVAFEIVRHQAKLEMPLKGLAGGGGQIFISTIAEVTFYGRDQNGNEVTVTGQMDVHFGDFADSQ